MIVLGLGSNIGDRLAQLRSALHLIKTHRKIIVKQVSPVYISDALLPQDAPEAWNIPYLNVAIRIETKLSPLDLLDQLQIIEKNCGRAQNPVRWSPRIIDIDILIYHQINLKTQRLTLPHPELFIRPFALYPLSDVAPLWQLEKVHQTITAWGTRHRGDAPFHTKQLMQRIDMPQLVGILNITPDSFSDGGQFIDPEHARKQATHLVRAGAEILDIGAQATSPNANLLTPSDEWMRLYPVLDAVRAQQSQFPTPVKISIDTYHPETAEKAIAFGVDWINDVTGLSNPMMRKVLASSNLDCVMMHHMSIPASGKHIVLRTQNPIDVIYRWANAQLHALAEEGISRDRIIFDPGIGFGKVPEHSLWLIKHAQVFKELGVRILYGHSRKLFIGLFTDNPFVERDIETLTIALTLAKSSIDYLRVHNVEACARANKVTAAL